MIFKKKYKRSSWMEGLLFAEKEIKRSCTVKVRQRSYDSSGHQVVSTDSDGIKLYWYTLTPYFGKGVEDYLKYYEENKEILLKTLDK